MEDLIYLGSRVLGIIWESPNKEHVKNVVKDFKNKFLEISGYEHQSSYQPEFLPCFNSYQLSCHFLDNLNNYIRFENNHDEMIVCIADVMNFFDMTFNDLD